LGFFKLLPREMIVLEGKKDLNYSPRQLKLLFKDLIVPQGNKDLSCSPRQFKFFFPRDMIVSQGNFFKNYSMGAT
jgi:hypothetical protein